MNSLSTVLRRHPWIALMGFFSPIWVVGMLVTFVQGVSEIDTFGPFHVFAGIQVILWSLILPLGIFRYLKKQNEDGTNTAEAPSQDDRNDG